MSLVIDGASLQSWDGEIRERLSLLDAFARGLGYNVIRSEVENLSGPGGYRTTLRWNALHPDDPGKAQNIIDWKFSGGPHPAERERLDKEVSDLFTSWGLFLKDYANGFRTPPLNAKSGGGVVLVGGLLVAGAAAWWYFYGRK